MGIRIHTKSKSPVVKEATKIASLIASFKFERGDAYTSSEGEALSKALEALKLIINRHQ